MGAHQVQLDLNRLKCKKRRAIVYSEYGGPGEIRMAVVEKPYPKADEVLIKVRVVSVNFGDLLARNFKNLLLCSERLYLDILCHR